MHSCQLEGMLVHQKEGKLQHDAPFEQTSTHRPPNNIYRAAPNLTKSLPCLFWGVLCHLQFLGPLPGFGGVDPIPLRVSEEANGNTICLLPRNNRRIEGAYAEHTNTKGQAPQIQELMPEFWPGLSTQQHRARHTLTRFPLHFQTTRFPVFRAFPNFLVFPCFCLVSTTIWVYFQEWEYLSLAKIWQSWGSWRGRCCMGRFGSSPSKLVTSLAPLGLQST